MVGIYKITNKLNGKAYIGQSKDIEKRWKAHLSRARYGPYQNQFLYQAIAKYGPENFSFEVLEECAEEDLDRLEIQYIKQYDTFPHGYNMNAGGGGQHCREMTPEHKAALAKALIGRPCSEETRRRISEAQKGKVIPADQREKIGAASKRVWANPEYRAKMSAIRRRRVISDETRRKIGASQKGKTLSEETKRKISEKNKGRPRTEEWREHLRQAHLGHVPTEETRRKMSAAMKGREFSDEHREKLRIAAQNRTEEHQQKLRDCKKGGKNPMARAVEYDGVVYETIAQCAETIGVPKPTLWRWLNGKSRIPAEHRDKNLHYLQL